MCYITIYTLRSPLSGNDNRGDFFIELSSFIPSKKLYEKISEKNNNDAHIFLSMSINPFKAEDYN